MLLYVDKAAFISDYYNVLNRLREEKEKRKEEYNGFKLEVLFDSMFYSNIKISVFLNALFWFKRL